MSNLSEKDKSQNDLKKLRDLINKNWWEDRKNFLGKVLTIIDACIADKEQRKSIKDLIQNEYYGNSDFRRKVAMLILLKFAEKHCEKLVTKEESYHSFIGVDPENRFVLEENPFK